MTAVDARDPFDDDPSTPRPCVSTPVPSVTQHAGMPPGAYLGMYQQRQMWPQTSYAYMPTYPVQTPTIPMGGAPSIHICKQCKIEVACSSLQLSLQIREGEPGIQCSAPQHGCTFFFHQRCTKLTMPAYQMLMNEPCAEWICDSCYDEKKVPLVQNFN